MAPKVKRNSISHPFKLEDEQTEEINAVEIAPAALAWLTLETVLYSAILVIAVWLRLWDLGIYPLSGAEAGQSLTALALYRGDLPESTPYSPLLLSLNTATFLLFGASDVSARLATVLIGSVLVLLPITLRRHLGSAACLIASFLLAISPSALFLSRTLNAEIGVAVGALMLVAGFFNWIEDGQQRWLWLAVAGIALMLTSGPMAFSIILVFGLIILAKLSSFKSLTAWGTWPDNSQKAENGEAQAGSKGRDSEDNSIASASSKILDADPQYPEGTMSPVSNTQRALRRQYPKGTSSPIPNLRNAGIFLVVSIILVATTATFNLSGFGRVTGFLVDWFSRFGLQTQPEAGFNAVFLLTIYEPLTLLAGLTGLAYVLLQRSLLSTVFAGWFVGLLVLDLFMGGRPNGNVILILVPLTFLAAMALAELWEGLRRWGTWGNEGIMLGAGLVIAGFGYIGLTGWLIRTCAADDRLCQLSWLQPIAALALFLVIVGFFGFINDSGSAFRGAALTGVAVGLLATINIGWRLNYGPLMHLAYQPLAGIPASTELVQLADTLTTQSNIRVGDPTLLDTTLAGVDSPALRWQLRDYRHLTRAGSLSAETATSAIITPVSRGDGLDLEQAYLGQDFALDAVWSPVGLEPKTFVQWLIYRQVNDRPQGNQAILWLRVNAQ